MSFSVRFDRSDTRCRLETWTFDWYEDLFAEEAERPSIVNVASKAYRKLALYKPGKYSAVLKYYDGYETKACWYVREPVKERKAKNVILFIGDGMTTSMITAARLLAHKSINGVYQSLMQMDQVRSFLLPSYTLTSCDRWKPTVLK